MSWDTIHLVATGWLVWELGRPANLRRAARRLRRQRRPDLSEVLAARVAQPDPGAPAVDVQDAVLRQDMRWLEDELAGRPSVI